MKYALGNMLNGASVKSIDSNAKAYIDAVIASGVSVTGSQKTAISSFVTSEKIANRWNSHKQIYFPIWASASANAICMKTLGVGTFVNSPTMSAGYVQGNGSTQVFSMAAAPSTLGLTTSAAGAWALIKLADSRTTSVDYIASTTGGGLRLRKIASDIFDFRLGTNNVQVGLANALQNGVLHSTVFGGNLFHHRRNSSGITQLANTAFTSAGTVPTSPCKAMGFDININASDAQFGGFGLNAGFSASDVVSFTLNLKNLWETCTGLSLP